MPSWDMCPNWALSLLSLTLELKPYPWGGHEIQNYWSWQNLGQIGPLVQKLWLKNVETNCTLKFAKFGTTVRRTSNSQIWPELSISNPNLSSSIANYRFSLMNYHSSFSLCPLKPLQVHIFYCFSDTLSIGQTETMNVFKDALVMILMKISH